MIRDEVDPPMPTHPGNLHSRPTCNPLKSHATRVSSIFEEGDYRAAVRLTCFETSTVKLDEATLAALQSKHPPSRPDSCIPPPPREQSSISHVTMEESVQSICSFPNESVGGPDGLRLQLLKDLISKSAKSGGKELLWALMSFVNLMLNGRTPFSLPSLFGANLRRHEQLGNLRRKRGGMRPIAIGHTLWRVAAKCVSFRVLPAMGDLLAPLQLGCGMPSGCKAAVHAMRLYIHHMTAVHVLLKLDFKNVFNSMTRIRMLMAVEESTPELLVFVYFAYVQPSYLFANTMCDELTFLCWL